MKNRSLLTAAIILGALSSAAMAADLAGNERNSSAPPRLCFRDNFANRLALDWHIIRGDNTHWSLDKNPGRLTITTQLGAIHGDSDRDEQSGGVRTKNMFMLKNPVDPGNDFSITLAVSKFEPTTFYQPFGLFCYDDDDNYLKWSYEYSWRKPNTTSFTLVRENDKRPVHDLIHDLPFPGKLWIRVTRRGPEYICAYSPDGQTFTAVGSRPWQSSGPKYIGFSATDAPEIDVCFDSFDLVSPPTDAAPGGK